MQRSTGPLLDVRGLTVEFTTARGTVRAVDDVSFSQEEGEPLGLVGESGCGKSVTALSLLRLVPSPPGRILSGQVLFNGQDLLGLSEAEMRKVRGGRIGMIFQEPMTVGQQLIEPLQLHMGLSKQRAESRALELLEMVGIPDPQSRVGQYPHQMSGGQRQRTMIALVLSCNPSLLIADEATTTLDVTIRAQILELLKELTSSTGTALILITHNLGVVARFADRVNVMYASKLREAGTADQVYDTPRHPCTVGLLTSVPRLDLPISPRLKSIDGEIPDLQNLPSGCVFRPRCAWARDKCVAVDPPPRRLESNHDVACWEHDGVAEAEAATL